ncbi:sodium/bile acid cotransporter-like [Limulus polyphemus]|uniref:Sodium/bile acid cotransporter-like n=1 Tax=Limulus polyphemus TaxID=6850 RepID=A0ABM1B9H3_LIMPO|nr:sodium/bile acid cotransporter-like [Limulus polyphemus]
MKIFVSVIVLFVCFPIIYCSERQYPIHSEDGAFITKPTIFPAQLLGLQTDEVRPVVVAFPPTNLNSTARYRATVLVVTVTTPNPRVVQIIGNESFHIEEETLQSTGLNLTFQLRGVFIGYATVFVRVERILKNFLVPKNIESNQNMERLRIPISKSSEQPETSTMTPFLEQMESEFHQSSFPLNNNINNTRVFEFSVSVIRAPSILKDVFTFLVAIVIGINFVSMGCQLDLKLIKKVLIKPVGPIIGFFCQFLFMPLVSYGFGYALLHVNISQRLGFFVLGCSPGGIFSTFWTVLLNGDVNLSITMTFLSSLAALGMMPFWIFTLGSTLFLKHEAQIPYVNLVLSLVLLTLPLVIGLFIRYFRPGLAKVSDKLIRPFTLIILILTVILACITNSYIFPLFTWRMLLTGMCIAWSGYGFGATCAWLARLPKAQIIAVSIETAFQNIAIAYVVLTISLPQPDADITAVTVVAQIIFTGTPMWIIYTTKVFLHIVSQRCSRLQNNNHNEIDNQISKKKVEKYTITDQFVTSKKDKASQSPEHCTQDQVETTVNI